MTGIVSLPTRLTNKVRLCERSEPQSNRLLDKPGLDEASSRFLMEIAF